MFEIATIISCVFVIIILKFCLNIDFKKIKNLQMCGTEQLKNISKQLPEDEAISSSILEKLKCKNVKLKKQPEYNNCLYTVYNNTIYLGKFQEEYMKPQTIAHECMHASQSKKMLWSNFIFTNIYLIYFITITILTFFNKIPNSNIHIIILIFLSFIQYVIRFTLENEAMIKAKSLSREYIEENNIINKEDKEILMKEYDRVNEIGIPFMNFYLISMNIIKIMIFAFICLI